MQLCAIKIKEDLYLVNLYKRNWFGSCVSQDRRGRQDRQGPWIKS
jgi:hypothetical protein